MCIRDSLCPFHLSSDLITYCYPHQEAFFCLGIGRDDPCWQQPQNIFENFVNLSGIRTFDTEPVSYTHLDVYKRQLLPHLKFKNVLKC